MINNSFNSLKLSFRLFTIGVIIICCCRPSFAQECTTVKEECIEPGGVRIFNGIEVYKECWKVKATLNCKSESKNDCASINYKDCSEKARECINHLNIEGKNQCTNVKLDYACSRIETYQIEKTELITNDTDKFSKEVLCKAFCIDGNCPEVYKAKQEENDEFAQAISQLQMLRDIRDGLIDPKNYSFNMFSGISRHCNRKLTEYTNCCSNAGWAKSIGIAKCSQNDAHLAGEIKQNKCLSLGKHCTSKSVVGCIVEKHEYCCFPNVLSKVIITQAKQQLGKNFGTPENPDCSGISLQELKSIDFSKINFKEFIDQEIAPRINANSLDSNRKLIEKSYENISNGGLNQQFIEKKFKEQSK